MRSWFAKILLLIAVVIITAHNSIPHDHDRSAFAAHHDHEEDDNDHKHEHGVFANNFLAHSFTQPDHGYTLCRQLAATPVPLIAVTPPPVYMSFGPVRKDYPVDCEYPPPRLHFSSSGFCGPPSLV